MIKLSEHFSYKKILKFVAPSIAMMVFASIYGVVDGLFISNFVGHGAFASINLIMPFIMILASFGFMIGSGGTALISKTLGEGNNQKANEIFTMLIAVSIITGTVLTLLGEAFLEPISIWFGARGENAHLLPNCVLYGRIVLVPITAFMLQNVFQVFFTMAEKPALGFLFTLFAGITNIVFDALFVAVFKWGIVGAAVATGMSVCVGGILPIIYFLSKKNTSILRFVKFKFEFKPILNTCTNGCSELMSNVSASIVSIVFNSQLLKLAGQNGVSAYGVLMYIQFVFISIFLGLSIGTAPIIGFNYGSKNKAELKNVTRKGFVITACFSIAMFCLAEALSWPIALLFFRTNPELTSLTQFVISIVAFVFLICGFNIFSSSLFTALGNGVISAVISFMRTLVFQISCVLILPLIFGLNGIWWSLVIADVCSLVITLIFLFAKRKKYGY